MRAQAPSSARASVSLTNAARSAGAGIRAASASWIAFAKAGDSSAPDASTPSDRAGDASAVCGACGACAARACPRRDLVGCPHVHARAVESGDRAGDRVAARGAADHPLYRDTGGRRAQREVLAEISLHVVQRDAYGHFEIRQLGGAEHASGRRGTRRCDGRWRRRGACRRGRRDGWLRDGRLGRHQRANDRGSRASEMTERGPRRRGTDQDHPEHHQHAGADREPRRRDDPLPPTQTMRGLGDSLSRRSTNVRASAAAPVRSGSTPRYRCSARAAADSRPSATRAVRSNVHPAARS